MTKYDTEIEDSEKAIERLQEKITASGEISIATLMLLTEYIEDLIGLSAIRTAKYVEERTPEEWAEILKS